MQVKAIGAKALRTRGPPQWEKLFWGAVTAATGTQG